MIIYSMVLYGLELSLKSSLDVGLVNGLAHSRLRSNPIWSLLEAKV